MTFPGLLLGLLDDVLKYVLLSMSFLNLGKLSCNRATGFEIPQPGIGARRYRDSSTGGDDDA